MAETVQDTLSVTESTGSSSANVSATATASTVLLESSGNSLRLAVDAPSGASIGTINAFPFAIRTGGEPRIFIEGDGDVGIGTSDPGAKLAVNGLFKLETGAAVNKFSSDVNLTENSDTVVPTSRATKTYIDNRITQVTTTLNTGLATKAAIVGSTTQDFSTQNLNVNGNLGIGTATPNRPLTIQGSSGTYFNVKANNGTQEILLGADEAGGIVSTLTNHDLQLRTGGNNTRMTIKAGGSVGIGTTSPHAQLTLTGSLGFTNATTPMMYIFQSGVNNPDRPIISHSPAAPSWGLMYRDPSDQMIFQRAGTPVMTVDLGGNSVQVARGMTVGSVQMPTEVGRLVVSGPVGEVVFMDRNLSAWPASPKAGDRFLWYTYDRVARLWTEQLGDVLSVNSGGVLTARGFVHPPSSRALKENVAELSGQEATEVLIGLSPVKFNYKADSQKENYLGFIAEDVPETVAKLDRKSSDQWM